MHESIRRRVRLEGEMRIRVLGSGCKKCEDLYAAAQQAVDTLGLDAAVEKTGDVDVFIDLGVRVTPALVIDEEVVSSGVALSSEEIEELLRTREA
jgi:small redox-active disulfide protein 2